MNADKHECAHEALTKQAPKGDSTLPANKLPFIQPPEVRQFALSTAKSVKPAEKGAQGFIGVPVEQLCRKRYGSEAALLYHR